MKIEDKIWLNGVKHVQPELECGSSIQQKFGPLALEVRSYVDTACAACHLCRRPQTLRVWASAETGPLRPIRVNGRLAWSVAEIRRVLQT